MAAFALIVRGIGWDKCIFLEAWRVRDDVRGVWWYDSIEYW